VTADASAQITELEADDHACLTFGESEELFDLTAAFVRDGLAAGLKVIWLSDAGAGPVLAELGRRGIAAARILRSGGWPGSSPRLVSRGSRGCGWRWT
jgi:hypothetical protein